MVHALDPPLVRLRQVDAAVVEESDHHRLWVVGAEPHRETGTVAAHAHVVTRHGHGRQLQVVDVDPDRVAAHHEGAVEDAAPKRRRNS